MKNGKAGVVFRGEKLSATQPITQALGTVPFSQNIKPNELSNAF